MIHLQPKQGAEKSRIEGTKLGNDTEASNLALTIGGLSVGFFSSFFLIRQLNRMLKSITQIVVQQSENLANVSETLSGSAKQMSQATNDQAGAIVNTVASMEEIAHMLSQTTNSAANMKSIAELGEREAVQGQTVLKKMTSAMDEIRANNEKLEMLVGLINDIQSKTKVINDIVFETRLLSFNASIEAARAGAHGKGFAVVAEEVGKLAAMSGKAADEIRVLLEHSTRQVTDAVKGTQERVNVGKEVSLECADSINSMGSSLNNIGQSITSIVAATKEQEAGVKHSNQALFEIDRLTQRNSANASEVATQVSVLTSSAAALNSAVDDMQQMVFGKKAKAARHLRTAPAAAPRDQESDKEKHSEGHLISNRVEPAQPEGSPRAQEKTVSRDDSKWKKAS